MAMAQKVKEAEITEQDSLLLTRNLLRIAIFNISYIRGLFPEKYFCDKSVPALDIKIKKLTPMDVESRRLIDWMEKGAYDALQKKYLKTLLFCICETVEGPMIEEYAFSFSYSNNDSQEVSMDINRTGDKKGGSFKYNSITEVTPNQMRSSACKMIRTLVQLMRTLDKMPEERTILMKLLYYDDVTPIDYEPPFFRGCTEEESHNTWTKNPLRMKVGNVNSKHFVLALKVKSVLDPCGDENDDIDDGDVSLGDDSGERDVYTDTESEEMHSQENPYMVVPVGKEQANQDALMVDRDDTQHPREDMEEFGKIKDWIVSRNNDKVELTDVLSNFPEISMVLIEEIMERLVKGAVLSKIGRDTYAIHKQKASVYEFPSVKEENDGLLQPAFAKVHQGAGNDYLYMKALYYALPMNYVTTGKLQNKLEANQGTVRKLIDKMTREGYLEAKAIKRLGKRVIKSDLTEKKLMEIKKALNNESVEMDTAEPVQTVSKNQKDMSTLGGLHSIGSDITRTRGVSGHIPNGSTKSDQTITKGHGNSPTSRAQPAASRESGVPGHENNRATASTNHHEEAEKVICSRSTQDKRPRKESMVKEPILPYVKRQKSAL
uniref:HORMA domain-containing protein n=1 Tax=Kalanchoe fedtschenkoi TaxID=63787 RepID=A0A7N0TX01_KALFE